MKSETDSNSAAYSSKTKDSPAGLATHVKPGRLVSIDALRGFNMFMIIGGATLIMRVSELFDWGWLDWLAAQQKHVSWHGFTMHDWVFPLFLFVCGVSMVFSIASKLAKGKSKAEIYASAFKRMILFSIIGILYKNNPLHFDWDQIRYVSVLGRIGVTGFFVTLIVMNTKTFQQRLMWALGILIVYWAAMMFIPVPGFGAGDLSIEGNLAGFIDRAIMPGRLVQRIFDENGWFEHIPATALVLMGAMAGELLKSQSYSKIRKVILLSLSGVVSIALGLLWGLHFTINKHLWSSSFILLVAGMSLLTLALFFLIIEVWGYKRWSFFFVVIGLNSIAIYIIAQFIKLQPTVDRLLNGFYQMSSEPLQAFLGTLGLLTIYWLLLYFFYKKRIFFKV
jgi:predicted acyltransferase